jgi:hypothetical protein
MVALAIAIHEAVAGRAITAGLASLAALLSHDAASIVLPTLPAIAWVRTRKLRPTLTWVGVSVALAGVWGIGYLVALRHGVTLPPKAHGGGLPLGEVPGILGLGLLAGLNLEDVEGVPAAFFGSLYAVTFAAAALAMLRPQSRERLKAHAWAIAGGAAWFVAGSLPLTLVLPDWNAWRASVPALGLAVALVGFAGAASPWLAGAVVVLKLVALGGAAPAPAMVSNSPPATASHMSFVRLARLQRTLDGARAALTLRHPTMPRGAVVKFWALPLLAEVGFQGPRAVRVWYGDSTITWEKFGGNEGMKRRVDVLLEFEYDHPVAAIVVEPAALELFRRGISAFEANDLRASDSLFTASAAAQPPGSDQFHGSVARNLSRVAFNLGEYQRADSLNRRDFELAGPTPAYYAMVARMAMLRNERLVAINAVRRCLMMDPNDRDGLRIARMLGMGGEGQLQR